MWLAVVLGGLLAGLPGGGEYAGAASAAAPLDQVQQDQHQERPLAALPAMPGFACEAAVLSPYDPDTGTLDTSALMDETLASCRSACEREPLCASFDVEFYSGAFGGAGEPAVADDTQTGGRTCVLHRRRALPTRPLQLLSHPEFLHCERQELEENTAGLSEQETAKAAPPADVLVVADVTALTCAEWLAANRLRWQPGRFLIRNTSDGLYLCAQGATTGPVHRPLTQTDDVHKRADLPHLTRPLPAALPAAQQAAAQRLVAAQRQRQRARACAVTAGVREAALAAAQAEEDQQQLRPTVLHLRGADAGARLAAALAGEADAHAGVPVMAHGVYRSAAQQDLRWAAVLGHGAARTVWLPQLARRVPAAAYAAYTARLRARRAGGCASPALERFAAEVDADALAVVLPAAVEAVARRSALRHVLKQSTRLRLEPEYGGTSWRQASGALVDALADGERLWLLQPPTRPLPGLPARSALVNRGGAWRYLCLLWQDLAEDARPRVLRQRRGDVVLVPAGWRFATLALEDSVSLRETVCLGLNAGCPLLSGGSRDGGRDGNSSEWWPAWRGIEGQRVAGHLQQTTAWGLGAGAGREAALGDWPDLQPPDADTAGAALPLAARHVRALELQHRLLYAGQDGWYAGLLNASVEMAPSAPGNGAGEREQIESSWDIGVLATRAQFKHRNRFLGWRGAGPQPCPEQPLGSVTRELLLAQHFMPRIPLVMRGNGSAAGLASMPGWRAHLWTPEYLQRVAGSDAVEVQAGSGLSRVFSPEQPAITMPFGRLVELWAGGVPGDAGNGQRQAGASELYLNLQPLHDKHAAAPLNSSLAPDFQAPSMLPASLMSINMWLGRADTENGTTSQLHTDGLDNIYVVVRGRKQFLLFNPHDSFEMYVSEHFVRLSPSGRHFFFKNKGGDKVANFSPLVYPLSNITRWLYPRSTLVEPMVVTLEAGDLFYLPAGWWHQVTSYGQHLSMNFWFNSPDKSSLRQL